MLKNGTFKKTITAAGTRERLTTSNLTVHQVVIQGIKGNTNDMYVGDSSVSATNPGITLDARDSTSFGGGGDTSIPLKEIWLDADTNGEGVNVFYLEKTY